ncbi:MORN repeat-containing protein [Candidatus Protochlamydia phocaeensis]|uniref:MORN repeat-containing protein n=1 Tax=Candidatus Protochlamydia phocaeensis TaxID=1414722 RepID=UPI000838B250|nr:hypothetical protein [Candidatus Protochlamydia phocaeensis]
MSFPNYSGYFFHSSTNQVYYLQGYSAHPYYPSVPQVSVPLQPQLGFLPQPMQTHPLSASSIPLQERNWQPNPSQPNEEKMKKVSIEALLNDSDTTPCLNEQAWMTSFPSDLVGKTKDQRPYLRGKFVLQGSTFEGVLIDLKKEGHGKLTYPNGDCYEGEFRADQKEGHGKLTYAGGDYYEGPFKNDRFEGKGLYVFADNTAYEGKFVDGKLEGEVRVCAHFNPSTPKRFWRRVWFKNGQPQMFFMPSPNQPCDIQRWYFPNQSK